jgi:hypothetical protein
MRQVQLCVARMRFRFAAWHAWQSIKAANMIARETQMDHSTHQESSKYLRIQSKTTKGRSSFPPDARFRRSNQPTDGVPAMAWEASNRKNRFNMEYMVESPSRGNQHAGALFPDDFVGAGIQFRSTACDVRPNCREACGCPA